VRRAGNRSDVRETGSWARAQFMPTREQLDDAEATVARYRQTIGDRCKIFFVVPDYFERRPKRCMNGWGAVFLGIAPDGGRAAMSCGAQSARDHLPKRDKIFVTRDLV
jgi:hypothetical protein